MNQLVAEQIGKLKKSLLSTPKSRVVVSETPLPSATSNLVVVFVSKISR